MLKNFPTAAGLPDPAAHGEVANLDRAEEIAGIGFWDFDTRSGEVRWSYGMEAIYGLPKGGFKGTAEDFICRIHPDDVARNLQESQQALDQRSHFDIRFRILRPDGSERWVSSRGAGRFGADGSHLGGSGFQIDITEQVQREQQLQLQAKVITTMAEGLLLVKAEDATILYANPRVEAMLGYAKNALQGVPIATINALSDRDPQVVADAIIGQLHAHGHWRGEVKNRCADGREIWTSCTVSELRYAGLGKIWVSVHTDINDKRLAQDAREEAMVALQRLSLNIQDSLEAERLAVSRDVHDQLGAALTGMRMQLEALAAKLAPLSPALAQDAMAIFDAASQTQRAARDICSRLRPALLDDLGLGEACRWYLKEWAQQSGLQVRTRLSRLAQEPDMAIATDMFRVLQELLTNIARHASARTVRVTLSASATALTLRVQDDGQGFAVAQRTQGFGLMGIRERVRHHGGDLQIASGAHGTRTTATMQLRKPA